MHKPDDTLTIRCFLHFHTVVLFSCLPNSCMHLACVLECLCLSWSHAFWTENNKIYKREFSSVSKETSPILGSRTSTSNILNKRGKNLRQFIQEMGEKKNWNHRCCTALYVNTQTWKFAKIFENTFILIRFIKPEHFLN